MAVTLEWVRDHYDNNPKNGYIDLAEYNTAILEFGQAKITQEQFVAVRDAFKNHISLPDYGFHTMSVSDGHVISVNIPSGAMLKVDGVEVI